MSLTWTRPWSPAYRYTSTCRTLCTMEKTFTSSAQPRNRPANRRLAPPLQRSPHTRDRADGRILQILNSSACGQNKVSQLTTSEVLTPIPPSRVPSLYAHPCSHDPTEIENDSGPSEGFIGMDTGFCFSTASLE